MCFESSHKPSINQKESIVNHMKFEEILTDYVKIYPYTTDKATGDHRCQNYFLWKNIFIPSSMWILKPF